MLTLLLALPFSADGDVEGRGMLRGDVRCDCGGRVVVVQLSAIVAPFVMVFDLTGVPCCCLVARGFCVVPLVLLTLRHGILGPIWKVLGE